MVLRRSQGCWAAWESAHRSDDRPDEGFLVGLLGKVNWAPGRADGGAVQGSGSAGPSRQFCQNCRMYKEKGKSGVAGSCWAYEWFCLDCWSLWDKEHLSDRSRQARVLDSISLAICNSEKGNNRISTSSAQKSRTTAALQDECSGGSESHDAQTESTVVQAESTAEDDKRDSDAKIIAIEKAVFNSEAVLGQALEYDVVSDSVRVLSEPDDAAMEVEQAQVAQLGTRLKGFPGKGWLRLKDDTYTNTATALNGSWVFMDGHLTASCLEVSVTCQDEYVVAVWPGVPNITATYAIELRRSAEGDTGYTIPGIPQPCVRIEKDLLPASFDDADTLQLRVIATVWDGLPGHLAFKLVGRHTVTAVEMKESGMCKPGSQDDFESLPAPIAGAPSVITAETQVHAEVSREREAGAGCVQQGNFKGLAAQTRGEKSLAEPGAGYAPMIRADTQDGKQQLNAESVREATVVQTMDMKDESLSGLFEGALSLIPAETQDLEEKTQAETQVGKEAADWICADCRESNFGCVLVC